MRTGSERGLPAALQDLRERLKGKCHGSWEPWHLAAQCGPAYLTGLERATSAALVAALISSAAPSMCAATSSAGMPL